MLSPGKLQPSGSQCNFHTHTQFFLGQSVQGGEAAMRLSLCEAANLKKKKKKKKKIRPHHRELRSLLFAKGQ